MTLRTALHISGESGDALKAITDVEKGLDRAGNEAAEAGAKLDKYAGSSARSAAEQRLVAQGANIAGKEWERASVALGRLDRQQAQAVRTGQTVVASSNTQRAGMQQLTMQLSDMSTMFAMGARPMQIFASQSGQVIQALQLMTGGTSRLAAFMGGPWGMALTGAALVLVPLIGNLGSASKATDELRAAEEKLASSIGTLIASRERLDEALGRNKQSYIDLRLRALEAAEAELTSAQKAVEAAQIRLKAAQANQKTRDYMLQSPDVAAQGGFFNPFGFGSDDRIKTAAADLKTQAAALNEASATLNDATADLRKAMSTDVKLDKSIDRGTAASRNGTAAARAHTAAISETQRAYDQAVGSAKSYADSLEDQVAKFGKSAIEIQRMEVAAKAAAIEAAGLALGTAAAAEEAANLARRAREAGAALESKQIQKATDDFNRMIVAIYDEIELSGLVGKEREYRALQLEKEGKFAEWAAQGLSDLDEKWLAYAAAKSAAIENSDALEREREAIQALGEQIDALVGSLGRMGGMGGVLGNLGRVLTSNNPIAEMLGMGGIGTIAGSLLGGEKLTAQMGIEFTKSIRTTFPGLNDNLAAKIGGTLVGVFKGVGIAGGVTDVARTLGFSKGAATGAGLGAGAAVGVGALASSGALGFGGAQAFLSTLGGPVGIIAGLALGALAGGVLSPTKRGGATVGPSGITGTWGNSGSRIETATGIGGGAVSALQQIADALGVNLGSFSSSVSVRKNDLRFDPSGSGISKTSKGALSFGNDEEALLKAVIKDAISDGAFEGLSEGFKAYLTSGDVEARLQDILSLRGVQQEAARIRDPQGFELGELDKWRDRLVAIATATGEGLADIEFVYGERRREILERGNEEALQLERDRKGLLIEIASLEGRSVEALAMTRALEKEATDASLHPLLDRRNALQDEAAAAATAAAEAAELARVAQAAADALAATARAIEQELSGLEREWLEVTGQIDAVRALDLAALLSDEAREKQQAIWAYKDAQAAALAAAAAQEAYARSMEQAAQAAAAAQKAISDEIAGLDRQWLQVTGQVDKLRQLDLAGLLSDEARAKQEQIWAYEDARERQAEADRLAAEAARQSAEAAEAAARAVQEHARAIEEAQGRLAAAYQKERGELESTRQKFLGFADTLAAFRASLAGQIDPSAGYAAAGAAFRKTAAMAQFGDEKAIGAFAGDANAFLSASRAQAGTLLDFQRDLAAVSRAARLAETNARGMASEAQIQIDKLDQSVEGLLDLNEKTQTVADLIAELNALQEQTVVPAITSSLDVGFSQVREELAVTRQESSAAQSQQKSATEAMGNELAELVRMFRSTWRGDHFRTAAPEDKVITVSFNGAQPVLVSNTAPIVVDPV